MTIPANLFVEAPEIQDNALTKLDNDVNSWPEEIIQKFRERIPQSNGMSTMVKLMKKDPENGTATGSIIINSSSTAVVVPVIIKEFTLYPLDVMIAKKKILPLTSDYFDTVMSNNEAFDRIEEYPTYGGLGRFEDANLWNAMYPPSLGRYAYASAGYPMLDMLSDNLDGSSLKAWINENPTQAVGFYQHGHADVIKKVANLKPVNMNEYTQSTEKLIPKNIFMLTREGGDKYNLLSSSDKVFSPALENLTRDGARKFISTISDHVDDDINEVDQNGEKLLYLPQGGDGVMLAHTEHEIPEEAKEFGHYHVKKKNGVSVEGVVIPKVIDFDQKPLEFKLFLGKTTSTLQKTIWGVRIQNSRFKPACSKPSVGQTGAFVYQPDKSHALATMPVTIKTVCDDCGLTKLTVMDLMGRPYHLTLATSMGIKRIGAMPDGSYLIPKEMHWVPMDGFSEVSNSQYDYAVKTAGDKLTAHGVKLSPNGFDLYSLRGVDKYAHAAGFDHTNLTAPQAKFLLASLGCGQEKIAEAFKLSHRRGVSELHGLNFLPLKGEKIAEFVPKAKAAIKIASKIRRNLFKEASYIDNSQTVDALLSLNFVTPDNLSKFVGKIPHFKATISNLASALIASRIGVQEIPEEATVVAMHRLIEVVDGLERLRAAQEVKS